MKLNKIFLFLSLVFLPFCSAGALDLFLENQPVQDGINVFQVSDDFTEIYEKLDETYLSRKNKEVRLESLSRLNPNAHIEISGERLVLVWNENLVGNFPRPNKKDWKDYGQLTTALILRMRENDPYLRSLPLSELYNVVVKALLRGAGEKGEYVFANQEKDDDEAKMLTSIGLEVGRDRFANLRVTGVFKNSSADKSGVKEGDLISEINGKRVAEMTDADLAAVLSGYNSGTVKVKLLTPNGNKKVTLRRATVVSADADVIYRKSNEDGLDILEIVVHDVSDSSVEIVNEALAKYAGVGGIIFDLRATGGTDERAAAKLAGMFLGQVPIMRIEETAVDELEVIPGGDAITDAPVVVLVSDSTHGTAEAIAGAFYENRRGVLVGTPTAGDAKMQGRVNLSNGGVLKVFNKFIKTGRGMMIDGRGVFPLVCLSSIKNTSEADVFFLNVINGQFNAHDYNKDANLDILTLWRACPNIASGDEEDSMADAVAAKILTDRKIYMELMDL